MQRHAWGIHLTESGKHHAKAHQGPAFCQGPRQTCPETEDHMHCSIPSLYSQIHLTSVIVCPEYIAEFLKLACPPERSTFCDTFAAAGTCISQVFFTNGTVM